LKKAQAAKYIEKTTEFQKGEPRRLNPGQPVPKKTFEFFINLLNIPLPSNEEKRFVAALYLYFLT